MTPADQLAQAATTACAELGTTLHHAAGWRTRGHGTTPVTWRAVMLHDTVTPPAWSRAQLTRLLRDGYTRLPGPIANVQLDRNGDATLIAAGRAYHAGPGSWPGIPSGNLHTIGVEAANAGAGSAERWTDQQRSWASAFATAAELPIDPLGHLEWAPRRKVDPWSLDMDAFRARPHPPDQPDPWEAFMESLTEAERARLKELARYLAGEHGTAGHSFARQTLKFLRDDSARLRTMLNELDRLGSSPLGLARWGVAVIRTARRHGWGQDMHDEIDNA